MKEILQVQTLDSDSFILYDLPVLGDRKLSSNHHHHPNFQIARMKFQFLDFICFLNLIRFSYGESKLIDLISNYLFLNIYLVVSCWSDKLISSTCIKIYFSLLEIQFSVHIKINQIESNFFLFIQLIFRLTLQKLIDMNFLVVKKLINQKFNMFFSLFLKKINQLEINYYHHSGIRKRARCIQLKNKMCFLLLSKMSSKNF